MGDHLGCAHPAPAPISVRLESAQPCQNLPSARIVKQVVPDLHAILRELSLRPNAALELRRAISIQAEGEKITREDASLGKQLKRVNPVIVEEASDMALRILLRPVRQFGRRASTHREVMTMFEKAAPQRLCHITRTEESNFHAAILSPKTLA